ncbi:MAG: DUF4157 domain-containing protein, partial [Myxococcota bacterium]
MMREHSFTTFHDEFHLEAQERRVPSPGKCTLTANLGASSASPAAPVQRKAEPRGASVRALQAEDTARWMDVAMRPDRHSGPVQRKARMAEVAGDSAVPGAGAPQQMPGPVQAKMERAFDADFSAVRVYEGGRAQSLGALAYTQGTDIHFAPGQYQPHSTSGQQLLGHELTHVVQQQQGRVSATAQAKGVAINQDESLEREADIMGERAARGESADLGGGGAAAVSSARAPVQRFVDPNTEEEVDIAAITHLGQVLDYLEMIQNKEIRPTGGEFRALMHKKQALSNIGQQLSDSTVEMMGRANSAETGLSYHHNVDDETLEILIHEGHKPNLGYADPQYFERIAPFTWRLKPDLSAAEAIRSFIDPENDVTIAECQTTAQAVFYHSILNTVGAYRFDAAFGSEDETTPENSRLLLQKDMSSQNPLNRFLAKGSPELDEEETAALDPNGGGRNRPNFRPAKVGGWYYIKNHNLYNRRHSQGIWGGENAIYTGRDEETGAQVFSGFGLEN